MNFTIFNSELSASISDIFGIWLALSVKATLIAGALLAICAVRNKWRPDHGMTLLWKSSFLALGLVPVLALTPGIKWSVGEFDSALLINTSVWKTWTNSGLTSADLENQAQQNSYNSATGSVDPSKAETLTVSMGSSAESDSSSKLSWVLPFQWLVVSVWGLVAVGIASCKIWALTIGTQRWFKNLKTSQAPDEWTQELAMIRHRLNVHRPVDLLISSQLISPVALGARRPRIVLPEEALSWSTEERQSAIAHELCHISNRDPEFQWLTAWVQSCFWFHPWIHRMTHWMTLDQERDGDQAALQSGATKDIYLNFLTHVASQVRSGRSPVSLLNSLIRVTGSGIQMASGNESSLKRRFQTISRYTDRRSNSSRFRRVLTAGVILAMGCCLGSSHLATSVERTESLKKVILPTTVDQQPEAVESLPPTKLPDTPFLQVQADLSENDLLDLKKKHESVVEPRVLNTKAFRINLKGQEFEQVRAHFFNLGLKGPSMIYFKPTGMILVRGTEEEVEKVRQTIWFLGLEGGNLNNTNSAITALNWVTRSFKIQNPETIAAIQNNPDAWLEEFKAELQNLGPKFHPDTRFTVKSNNPSEIIVQGRLIEMDWIQKALTLKTTREELVHVKFTILEMDESKAKVFAESWFEGSQVRSKINNQVQESTGVEEALKNFNRNHSPESSDSADLINSETDPSEETSATDDAPNLQFILPASKYPNVMKWVKDQQIEILSAPQVTTISGRQAQVEVTQEIRVINGVATIQDKKVHYTSQQIPFGLSIDLAPVVNRPNPELNQKSTINLNLFILFSEFLGYDNPEEILEGISSYSANPGNTSNLQLPVPRSRTRKLTTKVEVPDGAALLIGSIPVTNGIALQSNVPIREDYPYLGKPSEKERSQEVRKMRFIIVQPSIVEN